MSHEFDLITEYFKPLSFVEPNEIGIGDDGAVVNCPANHQLVVVTDTLIAGRHFVLDANPYDIAWKSLAVNLSDLAAMGARPAFYSLALTLSARENNPAWLKSFSSGLQDLAQQASIRLIGGDTTQGGLSITITAQGWVPQGKALLRSKAVAGADIYVSGPLGDGGLGLVNVVQKLVPNALGYSVQAVEKLNRPVPRLSLGQALLQQGLSQSAIDISDGFLADLTHILKASNLAAVVDYEALPLSEMTKTWALNTNNPLFGLNTGDDFELCFVAMPDKENEIQALSKTLGVLLTKVGQTQVWDGISERLVVKNRLGESLTLGTLGYQHF